LDRLRIAVTAKWPSQQDARPTERPDSASARSWLDASQKRLNEHFVCNPLFVGNWR